MTIGTGIAVAGVWIMVAVAFGSRWVGTKGLWIAIFTAFIATYLIK